MIADLCRCDGPNPECRRAGRPMVGELWHQCRTRADRRFVWDRLAGRGLTVVPVSQPRVCVHLGAVQDQSAPCSRDWRFACLIDVVEECVPRERFDVRTCPKYQPRPD